MTKRIPKHPKAPPIRERTFGEIRVVYKPKEFTDDFAWRRETSMYSGRTRSALMPHAEVGALNAGICFGLAEKHEESKCRQGRCAFEADPCDHCKWFNAGHDWLAWSKGQAEWEKYWREGQGDE